MTQVKEEFNSKLASIEDKWKKVYEERVTTLKSKFDEEVKKIKEELASTEHDTITDTNKKSFRPEIGYTTKKYPYLHGTYQLWGPVFVGGGMSGDSKKFEEARIGVGVEL
jgi:predicted Holliday junction resolvase-like endonuclease